MADLEVQTAQPETAPSTTIAVGVFAPWPTVDVYMSKYGFCLGDGRTVEAQQVLFFRSSKHQTATEFRKASGKGRLRIIAAQSSAVYPRSKPRAPRARPTARELKAARRMARVLTTKITARMAFDAVVAYCQELTNGLEYPKAMWNLDHCVSVYPAYVSFCRKRRFVDKPSLSAFTNAYISDDLYLRPWNSWWTAAPFFKPREILLDHKVLAEAAVAKMRG